MADEENSKEGFYSDLQPLNNFFDDAFSDDDSSLIEQEIAAVEVRYDKAVEIDKGGMKSILSTTDKMTLREVAKAKLLDLSPANRERFIKEARLTASLQHPNIIPVYDLGIEDGEPFFTMKMIEGENLSDLIKSIKKEPGKVSTPELMQIFLKVCDAVAFAHNKRVLHLDLKPANIRLGQFGEVIVCDWGLAKIIGEDDPEINAVQRQLDPNIYNDITLDGVVKGSPGYLAPEQISKDYGAKDERTDIYALGGILYCLLTLQPPVNTDDISLCLRDTESGNIKHPQEIDSSLSQSLSAVAMKALSVKKEDRYASVNELRSEISRWLSGFATDAEEAGFLKSVWLLINRHKAACGLMLLLLVSSVLFSIQILNNKRKALEAREMYLTEKENRRQEELKSVPHLYAGAMDDIANLQMDSAMDKILKGIAIDKTNESLWSLKGKVQFIKQEFNATYETYSLFGKSERALWIKPVVEKWGKIKKDSEFLTPEQMKKFILEIDYRGYSETMCAYVVTRTKDLRLACEYSITGLKYASNKGIHERFWDYDLKIEDGGVSLDFSRMKRLRALGGLRSLPVQHLNIANTVVSSTRHLETFPLITLNISNTKILEPRPLLKVKTLQKIYIAKDQYPNTRFNKRFEVLK